MEYRNAKYTADGRIDCEINHPKIGWVPFTASRNDSEKHGRDLFSEISRVGNVAPYEAPNFTERLTQWRENASLPRTRFALAAAKAEHITEAEAEDWAAGVAIPAWVSEAIEWAVAEGLIPEDERLSVRIAVRTQQYIGRNDRLIPILAQSADLTDEQVDGLFGGPPQ